MKKTVRNKPKYRAITKIKKYPHRGRPTKYSPEVNDKVDVYLSSCGREQTELPTVEGFAIMLNVNPDTLQEWSNRYKEFSVSLAKILAYQKKQLINDGIYGGKEVNSTIVKLLLQNNHGMKERTDVTTKDEHLPIQVISYKEV